MMDVFEYKVLSCEHFFSGWCDEGKRVGSDITTELLKPYGRSGWEVVATMQGSQGTTDKIILKRRRAAE